MKAVLISKDKLLAKVKENRNAHRIQFIEALEGWQEQVLKELEKAIVDAKSGIKFKTHFDLPKPVDHTSEYDSLIMEIEWNEEEQITLVSHDFNQFIRDDWSWKKDFMGAMLKYSKV